MEEKVNENVVTANVAEDETKKKMDWFEWMVQDLIYRVSKLENENQKMKESIENIVQDRNYKIQDVENKYYELEARLSDYNRYVLEMSNDYIEKYTHMSLSTS